MGLSDVYKMPKIAVNDKNDNLNVIADINKTMEYLRILHKRDNLN